MNHPTTELLEREVRVGVSQDRIRLGIIGCGAITQNGHLPAALSSALVDLTALSDTNESRLRYLARQFGLGTIGFRDYRDMLDHVDAVILAVPNHLHASIGCDVLARGVHVLCEKPLALSVRECEQLCHVARRSGSVLATGHVKRFFPSTELTKELMDNGFLGTVTSFAYESGVSGGWDPLSGYNLTRASSGGGVLVTNGSHFIDRMIYIFGPIEVLSYCDDNRGGVEANCAAVLEARYKGNTLRGRMILSKTHKLANRLRICGEKGVLEIDEGQPSSVTFLPEPYRFLHEIGYANAASTRIEDSYYYFRLQLEDFAQAIKTGTEPKSNGEMGSASVAIIEKCYGIATRLGEPWCDATVAQLAAVLPRD